MKLHPAPAALGCLALLAAAAPAHANYYESFDSLPLNAPYAPNSAPPTSSAGPAVPLVTSQDGLTVDYVDPATVLTTSPPPNNDPYGWVVRSNLEPDPVAGTPRFNFANMSGNIFIDFGNDPLQIQLSKSETSIALDFALRFPASCAFGGVSCYPQSTPTSLIADFYSGGVNGTLVGTQTITGIIPNGYEFPDGVLNYSGAAFDTVALTTSNFNYALLSCSPTNLAAGTCQGSHLAPVAFAVDNVSIATGVPEPATLPLLAAGLLGLAALRRRRAG